MKTPHIKTIGRSPLRLGFTLLTFALGCFAFSPTALAVTPEVDGGYGNQNTAEGEYAVLSLNIPANGTWTVTGSMGRSRYLHTATLLPSGKVLVAGGYNVFGYLGSAEMYDPATGLWTVTGGMGRSRYLHTATLLPSGKVLVAGGYGNNGYLGSAELYDPATGLWTVTGSMGRPRFDHTATLLPSGKVLVAGGGNGIDFLGSAELYDPDLGFDPN
jgi:hypothetical protein